MLGLLCPVQYDPNRLKYVKLKFLTDLTSLCESQNFRLKIYHLKYDSFENC